MECHCRSKDLYRSDYTHPEFTVNIDNKAHLKRRNICPNLVASSHPNENIEAKIADCSQMWLPTQIQRISWDQIEFNPLWFQKNFIAKNVPCVITDVLQGDDIFERWAQPQYLTECLEKQKHSVSLTPDGFADSIAGEYFIEPHQEKIQLGKFFDHQEHFPGAVPYIQHQNGNFKEQFESLTYEVPQEMGKFISRYFFKGKEPDAENLWLGFDQSVSSLHKDPYQNFYMPLVGEKHFTLMPPYSILNLQEQQYKSAKWSLKIIDKQSVFECMSTPQVNRWICVNPDLDKDHQRFPNLAKAQRYHVTVSKQEMLYLPSLWYHQVSQCRGKSPYVLALNYWFDMEFSQNYALYETCRALRNYP